MLSVSLREQIKCRWREFLREPSAFFWVVFMPLLWMVILGFSFSNSSSESYGVGWADSYKKGGRVIDFVGKFKTSLVTLNFP